LSFRASETRPGIQKGSGFLLEFIPMKIGAGMTNKKNLISKVDFKSTVKKEAPSPSKARGV